MSSTIVFHHPTPRLDPIRDNRPSTMLICTSHSISASYSIVGRNNGLPDAQNEDDLPAGTGFEGVYLCEAMKIDKSIMSNMSYQYLYACADIPNVNDPFTARSCVLHKKWTGEPV